MATPQSKIPKLNILSFGAGAIGTYLGGSLILAGHQVVFIEQPRVVDELHERGMRLDLTIDKRRKSKEAYLIEPSAFVVVHSLEDAIRYGPFDIALFALKSFDTMAFVEDFKPFASKIPPLLCLSNGVENEPAIASFLGEDKVIHGTVTSAIGRRATGDIVLEKLRGMGVAAHPLSNQIIAAFNDAFLNAESFPDAQAMKWSKMLTNLLANPLSAILNLSAAEIYANKSLYRVEIAVLRECLAVMKAQGIKVIDLPGTPVRALALAARLPLWLSRLVLARAAGAGRGGKMPSFHIDLHSGRGRSEVDFLHGAVVRAGKNFCIPTPHNQFLTETLLSLTSGKKPLDAYARQPSKLLADLEMYKPC